MLDAPLDPQTKIDLAQALGDSLTDQQGQVPDLRVAFATLDVDGAERAAATRLERDLDAQLERAATLAFRDSFLIGAGLALVAMLVMLPLTGRRTPMKRPGSLGRPAGRCGDGRRQACSACSLPTEAGSYEPLKPADPCVERVVTSQAEGIDSLTERLVLLGIDGAACRLQVSRETLTLELALPGTRTDAQIDALRERPADARSRG